MCLNPPLIISPVTQNTALGPASLGTDSRTFNIIRDDFLIGGTKQRILGNIMDNSKSTEFVYAGPIYGFAQIAIAYTAKLFNKKATIIIEKKIPMWPLSMKAKEYGARIIEVARHAPLKKIQLFAEHYVKNIKLIRGDDYITLLPFGLCSNTYIDLLVNQIKLALPSEDFNPTRIWLTSGSGMVLQALYKVFPNTYFNIVQVGKTIWPDQIDPSRSTLYISSQKFHEVANIQPPYPTVKTYDAKAWEFVLKYGQSGDYIWNVAKDP